MRLPLVLIKNLIHKPNNKIFQVCNRKLNIAFENFSHVSPASIKKTLTANIANLGDGHTCFRMVCPQCKQTDKKKKTTNLYINKATGNFSCVTCLSYGKWVNLSTYFSTKKSKRPKEGNILNATSELENIKECVQHTESNSKLLSTLSEEVLVGVWKKFNLPPVPCSAIKLVNIRIDPAQTHLYFPLENANSQVVGYRILHKKSEDEIQDYVEPSGNSMGVLCGKSVESQDTAILVPDISDFLVLLNSKIPNYVVCLPNGYQNLPVNILPSLERFSKIILWFGDDINSWGSVRSFSKKLGEERCFFIRPSNKHPLPHLLAPENDIKAIVASAQEIWHKNITTFSSFKEDLLFELRHGDKVHGIQWKRYPQLNKLLKGHRRGELTILTGPTGCGKTTLVSEYSLDLAMQGVNTLWGSFEISNLRLAKTMLQQFAEVPLDKNYDQVESYFANEFEKLPIYFMTFHGQQSVKNVMEAVEHAYYVYDIAHVVIDNLQFMIGMGDGERHLDRFWKQDVIIAALRTFATRRNCHVTLVIHPRKERSEDDLTNSSIFGGAKATQEADNVLILQYKQLANSLKGKKYLQISKNRYDGELGSMLLNFDKNGLSFAPKKKKEVKDAEPKPTGDS